MLNRRLSEEALNASVNGLASLLDGGYLELWDGPQPASTSDAPTKANHRLATIRFPAVAFQAAKNGVAVSNELTPEEDAPATGNASWYRLFKADHKTVVEDGSVGTAQCNMLMRSCSIQQHAEVRVNRITLRAKV